MSRHLLPFAALAFTLFFSVVTLYIREHASRNIPAKLALVLAAVFILSRGLLQSDIPFNAEKIGRAKDFLVFKKCLLSLKDKSKDKEEVAINYFRNPFVRYYTHRRCLAVFHKPGLEQLSPTPRYFIFMPYNDPQVMELYGYLNEHYTLLFQCNSERFPTLFFKKKD